MQDSFFKGLCVVELASVLAGPAVGMFFAEFGAKVIKVENKNEGGDLTRKWKLPNETLDANCSAYYCSVNWGKEVLFLDLKTTEDRVQLYKIISTADVVISNFKLASAKKIGMDYNSIKQICPNIIYAQLTAFGEQDQRPGFDVVLQAEAGFLYMTGEANGNPVKMPVALIDLMAAHQLKEGILLALLKKERTGEGSYITVSLLESALASLANQATNWLMVGHVPQRMGTKHPNIAPYGDFFYTKDQKIIVLAVGTDKQFKQLCLAIEASHLIDDERFIQNDHRVINREALNDYLGSIFRQLDFQAIIQTLHEYGIPFGQVRTLPEVFELPLAQAMILEDEVPEYGKAKRVKTVAFKMM